MSDLKVYQYERGGKTVTEVSGSGPSAPAGTRYRVMDGKTVLDNGVVGQLTTKQAEAVADAKAASAADQAQRNQRAAAQRAEAQKMAKAKSELQAATARLDQARKQLGEAQGRMMSGLTKLNNYISSRDNLQDSVGLTLAGAGIIVAVAVVVVGTGGSALVVGGLAVAGGTLAVAGQVNEHTRLGKDPGLADVPDAAGDAFGIAADVGEAAKIARLTAHPLFGVAGSLAGGVDAYFDAVGSVPQTTTSFDVFDMQALDRQSAYLDRVGQMTDADGQVQDLKNMTSESKRLQKRFDEAMADYMAKSKVVIDLLSTWSEPR